MSADADEELRKRIMRQIDLHGEESLNSLDRWRLKGFRLADDQCKQEKRQQQRQERALAVSHEIEELRSGLAVVYSSHDRLVDDLNERLPEIEGNITTGTEILLGLKQREAERDALIRQLQGELVVARAKAETREGQIDLLRDELAATKEALTKTLTGLHERDCARDDVVFALRAEIADLKAQRAEERAQRAEERVENLKAVQDSLVASARMAIDVHNEATNLAARKVEVSQSEQAARDELVALQARADAFAEELRKVKSNEQFEFERERKQDDMEELDSPPGFLLSRPKDVTEH